MSARGFIVAFLIVGFASSALAQTPPVSPSPVKRTIIDRADMPGTNLEVITAVLEVAPGFKTGRHRHPGVASGFVTEGRFQLTIDGQAPKTLGPGEGMMVPARAVHDEASVGDGPLKAIVTYVVEKGAPLVEPVKD